MLYAKIMNYYKSLIEKGVAKNGKKQNVAMMRLVIFQNAFPLSAFYMRILTLLGIIDGRFRITDMTHETNRIAHMCYLLL